LHSLVVNAATDEKFWQLPVHTEAALMQALPPGFSLSVCRDASQLSGLVKQSTAVVGWPFAPALARRAPGLKWVHFWTAGVPEGFAELARETLHVSSAAGINASSVAQHALFLVLSGLRGLRSTSLGSRRFSSELFAVARAPEQLSVTIVGHGHVGQRLRTLLEPLFREVRVVSRTPRHAQASTGEVLGFEQLFAVVRTSDVLVLALPLTRETQALLTDRAFYAALKPDVCIVNVARGGLVDEQALLLHLAQHPEASYFSDVAQPEPYPESGPLWASPQVVLTPHVAGRRTDLWSALEHDTVRLLHQHLPALRDLP
jgi:D-2-hydroxyacid dehydrogenase (NADP+)